MELSPRRLLRAALSVAMAATLLVYGAANAESLSAVFKMYKDACLPESAASSRLLGLPNRLACITGCIGAKKNFEAVQVLPNMEQPGRLDCECVLLSASMPMNRFNCERWDVQAYRGGSGNGSSPSDYSSVWNATFCPGIANPWYPVIDINKCIFMKNAPRLETANLPNNPCNEGYELFTVKDSTTLAQLQKYLQYLVGRGAESPPYWVNDTRNGTGPLCTVVFANGTVGSPEGCNAMPSSAEPYKYYPVCEKTLAFAGVATSDLVVINTGSNSLTWHYFSSLMADKNSSCSGSLPVLIETEDMFMHVKSGILSRGWNNTKVWIAKSAYVDSRAPASNTSECIALRVQTATDTVSGSVVGDNCNTPNHYICEARYQGTATGPGQSAWLVGNICPMSMQPPTTATEVRTVGFRCFFYTSVSYTMSNSSLPMDACSLPGTGNPYVAAMISSDFLMSRYYVTSISVEANWEVWMFNNGWNGDFIDGYAITSLMSGSTAFHLNSSGNPFKGNASISRPVLCRSSQQICNTEKNYWNFASASNSCVAVEMASTTWNQSTSNCQANIGSMLRLDSEAKFNQIRELLNKKGNLNQLFWVLNATNTGECTALQIPSDTASWPSSVQFRPCTDTQHYLCETPPSG